MLWPAVSLEPSVGAALPHDLPPYPEECGKQTLGFHRLPYTHDFNENTLSKESGISSPCSMQSAATRNAKALTALTAASLVCP